jgi:hypothetical protein
MIGKCHGTPLRRKKGKVVIVFEHHFARPVIIISRVGMAARSGVSVYIVPNLLLKKNANRPPVPASPTRVHVDDPAADGV